MMNADRYISYEKKKMENFQLTPCPKCDGWMSHWREIESETLIEFRIRYENNIKSVWLIFEPVFWRLTVICNLSIDWLSGRAKSKSASENHVWSPDGGAKFKSGEFAPFFCFCLGSLLF